MNVHAVLSGNIRLRLSDGREWTAHNVMHSGGLALIRDYLASTLTQAPPTPPSFVVLGSGTAPVTRFMSFANIGETFRTPLVQVDANTGTPSTTYHVFVLDSDNANQTVGSYMLVGGTATNQLGTGTPIAIANEPVPFSKDPTQTISLDWTITASGTLG